MKKLVVFALSALLILSTAVTVTAADRPVYVALGDSIAFGYGLADAESEGFTHLLSDALDTQLRNYAVNGMTSGGLFNYLNGLAEGSDDYENLRVASVITVTIGSNDLLGRLNAVWNSALSASGGQLGDAAYAALEASLTAESTAQSFSEGIAEYGDKLPKICEWLKAVNPDAQIIMTRFYNPYYGVKLGEFDFSTLCDSYIVRMNDVLAAGELIYGYTIADSYTPFNAPSMTNVDMATGSFDPHPNVNGHIAIYKAVEAVIDKSALAAMAEPETEPVTQPDTVPELEVPPIIEFETVAETAAETAAVEWPLQSSNGTIGKIVLAGVAVAAFAVTGIIMSRRNKKK